MDPFGLEAGLRNLLLDVTLIALAIAALYFGGLAFGAGMLALEGLGPSLGVLAFLAFTNIAIQSTTGLLTIAHGNSAAVLLFFAVLLAPAVVGAGLFVLGASATGVAVGIGVAAMAAGVVSLSASIAYTARDLGLAS